MFSTDHEQCKEEETVQLLCHKVVPALQHCMVNDTSLLQADGPLSSMVW